MGFRDEFRGTRKTYAEWSLERTTETGLRTNAERLSKLQHAVKSTFDKGIDRITKSQEVVSESLRSEIECQSQQICSEVQRNAEEIVDAVQQMSDYLGSGLYELRWSIERQTKVSEEILQTLLSSLSNESRQYWEQAVACYEEQEYSLAKERLEKALEANRTNFFAYQYLGFIGVAEDDSEVAIRNFDLARKFSKNHHHRALALSHLARSYYVTGRLTTAIELSKAAVTSDPEVAKFWYEHATYCCASNQTSDTISALKSAIVRDWNYWSVTAIDPAFRSISGEISALFDELRTSERQKASACIEEVKRAIEKARGLGATSESLNASLQSLGNLERKFAVNNVHLYREIQSQTGDIKRKALEIAADGLTVQNRDLTAGLARLRENLGELQKQSFAGYGFLCAIGTALVLYIAISALYTWNPQRIGPMRVFTANKGMRINATGEAIEAGVSSKVVKEDPSSATVQFRNGETTFSKSDLEKFGELGTGYVEDDARTITWFGEFFWLGCVPIAVWIVASNLIHHTRIGSALKQVRDAEQVLGRVHKLDMEARNAISGQTTPRPEVSPAKVDASSFEIESSKVYSAIGLVVFLLFFYSCSTMRGVDRLLGVPGMIFWALCGAVALFVVLLRDV